MAAGAQRRVLVVDDAKSVRVVVGTILERGLGAKVFLAADATEALSILERESIDLVVSDLRMPGMDGVDLLTICAKRWPSAARILLTAYADVEAAKRAVNEGRISRLLTKPVRSDALVRQAEAALEDARRRRNIETAFERSRKLLDRKADAPD